MVEALHERRIVLGVTGGIAAYKSPELVRRLRERGADVRVVMTSAAKQFVGELSLQGVSGQAVHSDLLDPQAETVMGHIALARWADLVLVAPATADFIARLRQGRANDLLAAVCLTTTAPLLVAPAMNQQMWQALATQDNIRALQARGVRMIGPAYGDQACGETGPGRMEEPDVIAAHAERMFNGGQLSGVQMLVTAGPTHEPIDTVRFISNRSSGLMGYEISRAAAEAGALVTLVSGPVALEPPARVTTIKVETADEMYAAVLRLAAEQDIFVAAAAVADYASDTPVDHKIKKNGSNMALTLSPTKDILAAVAALPNAPFTVGFAAETEHLIDNARDKLQKKSLNMIAANWVGRPDLGFDAEKNELHVLWADGEQHLPAAGKDWLSRDLVSLIADQYQSFTRTASR